MKNSLTMKLYRISAVQPVEVTFFQLNPLGGSGIYGPIPTSVGSEFLESPTFSERIKALANNDEPIESVTKVVRVRSAQADIEGDAIPLPVEVGDSLSCGGVLHIERTR